MFLNFLHDALVRYRGTIFFLGQSCPILTIPPIFVHQIPLKFMFMHSRMNMFMSSAHEILIPIYEGVHFICKVDYMLVIILDHITFLFSSK